MKLDYLQNINQSGDSIIRLSDFDCNEAALLKNTIVEELLNKRQSVMLDKTSFIKSIDCRLRLVIGNSAGIEKENDHGFVCSLGIEDYRKMIDLIEPFTKELNGHQWLFDLNSPIDFLLSPNGKW